MSEFKEANSTSFRHKVAIGALYTISALSGIASGVETGIRANSQPQPITEYRSNSSLISPIDVRNKKIDQDFLNLVNWAGSVTKSTAYLGISVIALIAARRKQNKSAFPHSVQEIFRG